MSKEAMKLALEALKQIDEAMPFPVAKLAQAALREALAEQPAQQQEPKLPEFYARFEDGLVSVYQRREDATPLLLLRENLPDKQPAQQEPVAWRDHVEQRLLTWRQSFVNKSGDQLALDDFMDKRSLDDLIDFVCSDYTSPQPAQRTWVKLTKKEVHDLFHPDFEEFHQRIEAKLKEKNQ